MPIGAGAAGMYPSNGGVHPNARNVAASTASGSLPHLGGVYQLNHYRA
jgi:hypothetical protein